MALNKQRLKAKIIQKVRQKTKLNYAGSDTLEKWAEAVAEAVIEELQGNGRAIIPVHAPGGAVTGTIN